MKHKLTCQGIREEQEDFEAGKGIKLSPSK
jgi:hypothetical protein